MFQFVPPETLPWAELYWPFRPRLVHKEKLLIEVRESGKSMTMTVKYKFSNFNNHLHKHENL
jgi:hypothetical protein